jgi:hypothetical protein
MRGEGVAPTILNIGTGWEYVVSFTPRTLYPREMVPGVHCIGELVGQRAVLNILEERKTLSHADNQTRFLG